MFGFFRKKAEKARQEAKGNFDLTIQKVKISSQGEQLAFGHGVDMASAFFFKECEDTSFFISMSKHEKMTFIQTLARKGENAREVDSFTGTAFDLFKIWVVAIMQEDMEMAEYYSSHLCANSKINYLSWEMPVTES